jgi:small subunit ribosomal protein S6
MDKYEMMFIVKTTLDEATVKKTVDSLSKVITDMKGKLLDTKDMGQRELAYPIKKEISGFYYVFTFEANSEIVNELDRKARINENIIRHLVIKLDEE